WWGTPWLRSASSTPGRGGFRRRTSTSRSSSSGRPGRGSSDGSRKPSRAWRRARVLWAALDDSQGRMSAIAAELERALAAEFPPERRAFTPHLTVARFDPPVELGAVSVRARTPASEPFRVDRIVLFRSHLRRPAPIYEAVDRFP